MSTVLAPSSRLPATRPRIGLVLGGGGARGLGHVLMLEVFEELGVRPTVIAGTSIGAIYGAAFASGLSAALIRAHTEEILSQRIDLVRQLFTARAEPVQRFLGVFQLRSAILDAEALLSLLLPSRIPETFAALELPLRIVATDVNAQDQVVIGAGPLRSAIAASIALPAIFAPVRRDGLILLDGGLVNPLPFDTIGPAEADVTVAIDVSGMPKPADDRAPNAREALIASWQIPQRAIVMEKLRSRRPDIYIDVDVESFNALEFLRFRDILAAAAPAKARLKAQLARVLGAETLPQPPALAPPQV
jgi:NTE family protein